ncbi:MAG: hypothetical protein IKI95_02985 [Clostridia bacterium]|nr:hypothetical protein [Clostridia bacterium]
MALNTPFINGIPAFDAEIGTSISLNVFGGDRITSFAYSIYINNTNEPIVLNDNGDTEITVYVSNDSESESIRSFSFEISAGVLTNNQTYKISAYTQNGSEKSSNSNYQLFNCYKEPSFGFKYYNGSNYVELLNNYTVTSPELMVQLEFNKNDDYSEAVLNYANLKLFGIKNDGKEELIFEGETLYNEPLEQIIKNFSPTSNGIYTSFTLWAIGITTDNMIFSSKRTGLLCSYPIASEETNLLRVENICNAGLIDIWADLSSIIESYTHITISYKEENDTEWVVLQTILDSDLPDSKQFSFKMPYCGCNRVYNFKLDIYSNNNVVLIEDIKSVLSYFNKNYICDKDVSYNTTVEYQLGSVQLTTKISAYEPYGSQFPIVSKNAVTKYREGQTTALLLAPTSLSNTDAQIDRFAQVRLVDRFNDWLSNGKGKVLKDFNGNLRLIAITTAISNSYFKELGNGIASTSFSWKEVGKFNQDSLERLGMLNNFKINYIS